MASHLKNKRGLMADQTDKERYEQNFRDLFSKLNRTITGSVFALTMTIIIAFWGSLFGLLYNDMQNFKQQSTEQRIEIIRELGEVKTLIADISK